MQLIIFNNLNFMAFCLAIVRYLYTITNSPAYFTYQATVSNLALIILFVAIAFLIHFRHYRIATITSFALAPLLLTISGILTNDSGTDMYLVLYMMLAFFSTQVKKYSHRIYLLCHFFYFPSL